MENSYYVYLWVMVGGEGLHQVMAAITDEDCTNVALVRMLFMISCFWFHI